jgi:hypothetical protein
MDPRLIPAVAATLLARAHQPDRRVSAGFVQGIGASPARARVSPSDRGHPLRLASLLAFPTIGVEQLVHTDRPMLVALPLYQALHWLSDSLLALPLAAVAVWGGQRLAARLGLGASTPAAIAGRTCLIAVLFALVLVPGAALHEGADRLTHAHALVASHSHVSLSSRAATGGAAALARAAGHALSDGLAGQAVGLPLVILALWWGGRRQRASGAAATKTKEA